MNKLFTDFVNWTDTFFEDTASKLVRVLRILSKVFVWFNVVAGWLAMVIAIINAIATKSVLGIFLALLWPFAGYLWAILVAIGFALSIMTLNALSDINAIRHSVENSN